MQPGDCRCRIKNNRSSILLDYCLICCLLVRVLIVEVSPDCVPSSLLFLLSQIADSSGSLRLNACSFASVSGPKGDDSALYSTPKHAHGVTSVVGCTTGSPPPSRCILYLLNTIVLLLKSGQHSGLRTQSILICSYSYITPSL